MDSLIRNGFHGICMVTIFKTYVFMVTNGRNSVFNVAVFEFRVIDVRSRFYVL